MSFSKDVKDELLGVIARNTHCQTAELAGIVIAENKATKRDLVGIFQQISQDDNISRKVFTLLKKTLNIRNDVMALSARDYQQIQQLLHMTDDLSNVDDAIIAQPCCKRAFIRGAFLVSGSISDPNKGYHFEIVCHDEHQANQLVLCIKSFGIEAKTVRRSGKIVVYLKEGAQIVEMLRVMACPHSVMELENIRVVKEVRGSINRKVNCETANISKTVNAAVRQIEDIQLIGERLGLDTLPEPLQEIAQIRLEHPDTPLGDLGQYLDPPIGKSGVNHRFKKLAAIAELLR